MALRTTACVILVCSACFADTLVLKNGNRVDGTYVGGDARTVRMTVGDRVENFQITEITSIQFGTGGASPMPAASTAPAPAVPATELAARPDSSPSPSGSGTEIPAGTTMTVRMIDSVDSERDKVGQTFRASLDEPLMINGETVLARGADVLMKLVDQKQSGKIQGETALTLDIVSVTVDGRPIDVNTAEVTQASAARGSRSTKVIGGTAAVGAIIGAIAGGGKGAAIGGLAGAGAGTAAQVITKGQRVKIPSETRLTFTLDQPVRL
jgi:hypothetical protein